jgi:hypothetical protein
MAKEQKKRKGLIWNEDGYLEFNKQQSNLRWRLCKEALRSNKFNIKLKNCYESKEQMLNHSLIEFIDHRTFDYNYKNLMAIGWDCTFLDYFASPVPEGVFFPFVRFDKPMKKIIDTGCIWAGSRSSYPRIYVDNRFCKWYFPISVMGEIIREPFVPFNELKFHSRYLMHESSLMVFERKHFNSASMKKNSHSISET